MEEQLTCGRGLAENAVLPAKLAELMAALALNLEVHQRALDSADENSLREYDAYAALTGDCKDIAERLRTLARQMAGYRDLPMGKHDDAVMSGAKVLEAFERFVKVKRELEALLDGSADQDQKMLVEMAARALTTK